MTRAIAWFRRDLRLVDNPAWAAATAHDRATPLLVLEPALLRSAGPFRRAAFFHAVSGLDAALRRRGGRLRIEEGDPAVVVARVAAETGADEIHANADVTRWAQRRDARVAGAAAVPVVRHWGTLVHPPGAVLTKAGTLSRVFTPFHKRWAGLAVPDPCAPGGAVLDDHPGAADRPPGEAPVHADGDALLDAWIDCVDRYPDTRDLPGAAGTSLLSTALRFGTVSARAVVRAVGTATEGRAAFVRQLAWRDWYAHLTDEQPDIDRLAMRPDYDRIRWETGPHADAAFVAWREGTTGYPIVDAGMRELAATGWMHNRVRMITASFLVKDLLIDWRRGERWFRHMLSDGDVAQNAGNWQWVAGTGPDAAPYFRVFNPVLQSRRFDPEGRYIRRWVPELAGLPDAALHAPWEIAPLELAAAGVTLGADYPAPIVDHARAKEETLLAYREALDADPDPGE